MCGTASCDRLNAVVTFQRRAWSNVLGGVEERLRHRAARVVHHDVDATELAIAASTSLAMPSARAEVAGDGDGLAAEGLDLLGDIGQLIGAAGADDDVGADLRERGRDAGTDASPAGGDDRHLAVESEEIEDHGFPCGPLRAGIALVLRPRDRMIGGRSAPTLPAAAPASSLAEFFSE